VCAERNAVAAAVAAGARAVRAVAVVTPTRPPGTPCGACRQVLAELGRADTRVLLAGPTGPAEETTVGVLLPHAFRLTGAWLAAARTPPDPPRSARRSRAALAPTDGTPQGGGVRGRRR